jgi:predicted AAA+ superfamily ATPase
VIPRQAEPALAALARGFPVVALTGPRQSGKTTLARLAFPQLPYLSLELPQERAWADEDPVGFLDRFPDGAVLDEIQYCPGLFSHLQVRVDAARRMGHYVITGSQQFGLGERIAQSLAGRVGGITLLPLSVAELAGAALLPGDLDALLMRGFYPALYDRELEPVLMLANYVNTYLERDLRQLQAVRDLSTFQRFLRLCAGRTGQLLNMASLASDTGVSPATVRGWLSILQASSIITLLQPHHANLGKRLVKIPKLYFVDVGLAAHLIGIHEAVQVATHPLRGPLFETLVVGEFLKDRLNRGLPPELSFWRDNHGHEVDLLRQNGALVDAIEVKAAATPNESLARGLRLWAGNAGGLAGALYLVTGGDAAGSWSGVRLMGWRDLARIPG